MFDNQIPQPNSPNNPGTMPLPNQGPEDIFAGTDKAAGPKPPQFQPKNSPLPSNPYGQPPAPNQMANTNMPAQVIPAVGAGKNRKYIIIGVIAIAALLIILVAMIALAYFKAQEAADVTANLETTANENNQPANSTDTQTEAMDDTAADSSMTETAPVNGGDAAMEQDTPAAADVPAEEESSEFILDEITDADGDGLTDGEEKRLGTNTESSDSDGDGLFDRQEVRIYRTDPTNPDTDGDGYTDGEEVDNGYNPAGEGKLHELP